MAEGIDWLLTRIHDAGTMPALVVGETTSTYKQLGKRIQACRQRCHITTMQPGAVVSLQADYSLDGIAWLLALAAEGYVVMPLTTRMPQEIALRHRAVPFDCQVIVQEPQQAIVYLHPHEIVVHPLIETLRQRAHAGLILFSSGSTGQPKAILHDLDTLMASYQTRKPKALTMLPFLLFDHIGGIHTLLTALAMTATLVLPTARDPDSICALIAKHRVRLLPTSPTFLNLLLVSGAYQRHDLSSLRIVSYGTEPMPQALLVRLKKALPRVHWVQTFGTSETGIAPTTLQGALHFDDPSYEHRVVDGELWLCSKTQMLGYLTDGPSPLSMDGWFRTGDLAVENADGSVKLMGRTNPVINVGGLKVYPAEVEAVLRQMPGLIECRVHGEPSTITGQMIVADVLFQPSLDVFQATTAVRQFAITRLEAWKIPSKVRLMDGASKLYVGRT